MKNDSPLASLVARTIRALEGARLPLDLPGIDNLEDSRARLITQLRTRVLPHLRSENLPAVVVFGGSSGAGKSTLFNTLVGSEVSPASVLRPTTRTPVIAVHPVDAAFMEGHPLLEMGRTEYLEGGIPGIVLVDAPDLDSVDADNRALSRRLLDAADLWIFVTTAARYGDAYSWRILEEAHERGASTAVILNRLPAQATKTISADLTTRMKDAGLGGAPLIQVPDAGPHEGLLPSHLVTPVREYLLDLAGSGFANRMAERTTEEMLPALSHQLVALSEAVDMQADIIDNLNAAATGAAQKEVDRFHADALSGRFGRGAPTTAWLSAASEGGPLATLSAERGPRWTERSGQARRDSTATDVFRSVASALGVALRGSMVRVVDDIAAAWGALPIDSGALLGRARQDLDVDALADAAIGEWKTTLKALVEQRPAGQLAEWFGAAGLAALLGVAAGGVKGASKLARAGFGDAALDEAREGLAMAGDHAFAGVVDRYREALDGVNVGDGRQLRLRAAEFSEIY